MLPTPAQHDLDKLVINTELTLLSITQAIALSFLAEASVEHVVDLDYGRWPYIVAGLLVILVFWSRSLLHVLTIIRWPLEFAHNFLYIAFALIESLMFKQIGSTERWFALSLACAVLIWVLFASDLRMLKRLKTNPEAAGLAALITLVEKDQRAQLKFVVPVMIILSALAWGAVFLAPGVFARQPWHLLLIGVQILFLLGYLVQGLRLYRRMLPLIIRI